MSFDPRSLRRPPAPPRDPRSTRTRLAPVVSAKSGLSDPRSSGG